MSEVRNRYRRVAAERAVGRPFFMARDLAEFRALHGFAEPDLAAWLGCAPERLPELALCRRPAPRGVRFRHDVQRISERVGISPERLAQLLREVDAVDAFLPSNAVSRTGGSHGILLAARDRIENPPGSAGELLCRHDEESPEA